MIPPCEKSVRDMAARMRRMVTPGDLLELLDLVGELRKAAVECVIFNEGLVDRTDGMSATQRRAKVRTHLAQVLNVAASIDKEIGSLLGKAAGAAEQLP